MMRRPRACTCSNPNRRSRSSIQALSLLSVPRSGCRPIARAKSNSGRRRTQRALPVRRSLGRLGSPDARAIVDHHPWLQRHEWRARKRHLASAAEIWRIDENSPSRQGERTCRQRRGTACPGRPGACDHYRLERALRRKAGHRLAARIAGPRLRPLSLLFYFLVLALSALSKSSRAALILLLGLWIAGSLIAPRAASELASLFDPTPSRLEFDNRLSSRSCRSHRGRMV